MSTVIAQGKTGTPILRLSGVGPRIAERLARLGIHTVEDLLFHLPLRYEDRTRVVPIGSLRMGDAAVVQGEVQLTDIRYARRRMLLSRIADGTGSLTLRFFHFNAAQQATLARGVRVRCYGEVRRGKSGLELVHPEFSVVDAETPLAVAEHLTPIYPTTEGLHQLSLRQFTDRALKLFNDGELELCEWLPADVLAELALPSLSDAVVNLHRPPPDTHIESFASGEHTGQRRLAFEELLAHQLSLQQLRQRVSQHRAVPVQAKRDFSARLIKALGFELTEAQLRVTQEIRDDLSRPTPMQRLVQGDVGSGKTVVAALAALDAIESGYQVALMAPTELLAEQHFQNLSRWCTPLGVQLSWLSGSLKTAPRREAIEQIKIGATQLLVGTHALFQKDVEFANLALIIVDEQHRFGVHQRLALREKGGSEDLFPHQLIMTATPIPRTLAQTAYADLDYSVVDELPPGRKPVDTVVVPDKRRDEVVQRLHQACKQGRQAYWVCTLIEESETLEAQAAEDTAAQLQMALPDLRIGLVHGRLKSDVKESVMQAFKSGELDLLVATTVIEVGVDVPNASLMVIENPERLGLAQLHQLRGRVGRGSVASSCVLLYHGRLSENAQARLAALRDTNDGFEIARRDLELRGPGELLGTRQAGIMRLRIADLQRDIELLPLVHKTARELAKKYPQNVSPLIRRWIGDKVQYRDA